MDDRDWMLWDGECGLCGRVAAWVRWKDVGGRFRVVPYQKAPSPPMTPALYAACEHAVHVVRADGTVLRAGRATLYLFSQIGYAPITQILMLPPLLWTVEILYKIVANHRDFFANFFFRRDRTADADKRERRVEEDNH